MIPQHSTPDVAQSGFERVRWLIRDAAKQLGQVSGHFPRAALIPQGTADGDVQRLYVQIIQFEQNHSLAGCHMTLLEAMARREGFYAHGTRPQRNHNPGDIEYGKFARAHGATGSDGRFAIFPDEATGFAAMRALLASAYKGLTIGQALNKWAPPTENNTNSYLADVCHWTGLRPDELIDSHLA